MIGGIPHNGKGPAMVRTERYGSSPLAKAYRWFLVEQELTRAIFERCLQARYSDLKVELVDVEEPE